MNEQQATEAAAEPVEVEDNAEGSRAERLQWCKDRAIAYLPDDPVGALSSMISDLRHSQHEGLAKHRAIELAGMHMMLPDWLNNAEKVGTFIKGFN